MDLPVADRPDRPSWALIDIDPGPATTFDDVIVLARLYRTALDHLGVQGRPEGDRPAGVQIWVPVGPAATPTTETRDWVEALSRMVGSFVPELVSWNWRTDERGGLARLDFTQNAPHKTLVAPWSVRPAPGAPVSVPHRSGTSSTTRTLAATAGASATSPSGSRHPATRWRHLVGLPQELPSLG